jgi:hypothetical protein
VKRRELPNCIVSSICSTGNGDIDSSLLSIGMNWWLADIVFSTKQISGSIGETVFVCNLIFFEDSFDSSIDERFCEREFNLDSCLLQSKTFAFCSSIFVEISSSDSDVSMIRL